MTPTRALLEGRAAIPHTLITVDDPLKEEHMRPDHNTTGT
ncbi:hypothetical protein ABIC85_003704 [Oerskovia enterophila]|jgi:hypothetical protein